MRESRDWGQDETQTHKPTWNSLTHQSAPPALVDKNKKTCEIMQPFKREKNKSSTELLLGIYLTKLNEEEEREEEEEAGCRQFQAWAEGRGPTPLSPSLPSCCRGRVWAWPILSCWLGTSGLLFFSFSILTPTDPPPTYTLDFSPMVLSFQSTKHLTWRKTSFVVICIWDWTQKKWNKNRINVLWTLQKHF